jgi:hypothetical protein
MTNFVNCHAQVYIQCAPPFSIHVMHVQLKKQHAPAIFAQEALICH